MKDAFLSGLLNRPYIIMSVLLLIAALGFIGFKSMPLNLFPDANYPSISVLIPWPGASAGDVEDKVTRIIEKELSTINMVRKVKSVSQDEMAAVSVEFEYGKGLDAAATDVANVLRRMESKLPRTIKPPQIYRVSDATKPVFTIALIPKKGSHLDLEKVRQLADNEIREAFLRIKHVANVEVFGGYFPEITIEIDQRKLMAHNLSLESVTAALWSQNLNIPIGLIIKDGSQYLLKARGERLKKNKLEDIVVTHTDGGGYVYLRDIARVRTGYGERQSLFRGQGKTAIALNILRAENGHVTTTIKAVEEALPGIEKRFPEIDFEIVDTQKELIETSISNMVESLRDAILMTVSVIFIMLANIRMSLLAAVSIPFTYCLTFAGMYLFGYELNIVTLTAIIVAVGLLLDDAIVVIENIERHYHALGKNITRAVREGLGEILLADWSGTYTTVVVLIPIMFIGGYVEKILRPFTVVLAMSLLASFVVSVTVIPLLAQYLVLGRREKNVLERLFALFDRFVVEPIKDLFASLIRFALRHKVLFIVPAIVLFIVSIRFVMPIAGRDLMPPMDTGILKLAFEMESSSSMEETERAAVRLEEILQSMPGLKSFSTAVGSEPGVISFGSGKIPQQGLVTAHFVDRFHRDRSIWEIEDQIRKRAAEIPGIKYLDVYEFGATPLSSMSAPVNIRVSGPDPRKLDRIADEVVERLIGVKGLTTVSRSWTLDKKDFLLGIDLEKAKLYGLDPISISNQLIAAVKGSPASVLRVPGQDGYTIRVRYPWDDRNSLTDVESMYINSKFGPIPVKAVARVSESRTRTKFTREELMPTVDVYGYRATTSITHLQKRIDAALEGLELPPGYELSHEGEVKNMNEAGVRLAKTLGIAIILLFFSLAPSFRSWLNPVVIMVAIPLAMIGAAWGLVLVGRHACMPANMGMILLAGIVVNNSILLIDFIEKARKKGVKLRDAIEEAVRIRTRPILMTALSTIVGMIPVAAERALGLERLSPLAVVAIGGLMVSTFLTLIYIPIFYEFIDGIRQWSKRWMQAKEGNVGGTFF